MATPGWYPDPSGQPGAYRYWDGQTWGDDVTDNPFGGPPRPPVPDAGDPFAAPTVFPGASSEPSGPPESDHTVVAGGPSGPPPSGPPPANPPANPPAGPPPAEPTQVGWSSTPSQPSWQQQPAPYQGYQPPGASYPQHYAQPMGGPPAPSGRGRTIGLVLLAVVLVVAIGIGSFFVVRGLTDDGDDTAGEGGSSQTDDPTSDPTETDPTTDTDPTDSTDSTDPTDPTEDPGGTIADPGDPFTDGITPVGCAGGTPTQGVTGEAGGTWTGGGLSMPKVPGYRTTDSEGVNYDQSAAFEFADGVLAPSQAIEAGWASVYALGGLRKATFADPGAAAAAVMECMSVSPTFYRNFTGAELTDSTEIEVDGAPAWEMDAVIRIDDPDVQAEGDVAKVVVVDTGDPQRWGMFVSVVPIGDDALIAQQQSVAASLSVG